MAKIDAFFKLMHEQGASDLHLVAGQPPALRIRGEIERVKYKVLTSDDLRAMLYEITPEYKVKVFEETGDVDYGYEIPGLARYRANFFMQKNGVGAVFREIPSTIMTAEQLELPAVISKLAMLPRGLVLVTGPTGSGKSTTLASVVDVANRNRKDHIITVEDPIEFVHQSQGCIINQREVGLHTKTFSAALRGALREDPDIILVGEMRDLETIETAITAAETGHLVLSTLHTLDAAETINRIVAAFPPFQQKQIRLQLASVLKAVVSQRLLPRADGQGRVPAAEILLNTARVREYIEDKDKTRKIREAIAQGFVSYGMQTFDQSLLTLLKEGLVTLEEALRQASNPDDFALRVRGVSSTSDLTWDDFEKGGPAKSG